MQTYFEALWQDKWYRTDCHNHILVKATSA